MNSSEKHLQNISENGCFEPAVPAAVYNIERFARKGIINI